MIADLARAVPAGLLISLPIVLPLLGAAVTLVLRRTIRGQRVVAGLTLVALLIDTALLLVRVDADGPLAAQAGSWPAPMGITLVADRSSALLACVSAAMLLAVLQYATGQGLGMRPGGRTEAGRFVFAPVYLVLAAGVSFCFLTGDLFNLFVAFEVMLIASYVLVSLNADPDGVRASMTYIVVSLLASGLFVSTVGLVYAATGTVNLADLFAATGELPAGMRNALALMLIAVFGIKAALFPLYFWLPDSYPLAPSPVTAVFAGLLTKVGVYAIIRTQAIAFPDVHPVTGPVLLVAAGATLLFGIFGSIAQNEIKRVLSFTIVSHIGFMIMGLGLFTVAGIAGALFYVVHHIVTQTTLFCVEGLIERRTGISAMDRISGLATSSPLLGLLYALPALGLAGFPPTSGFIGKAALVRAGVEIGSWPIVVVALIVSLLTVYAMARVWGIVFWGSPSDTVPDANPDDDLDVGVRDTPRMMTVTTIALVGACVAIPVVGGPLFALCLRAAAELASPQPYLQAVLGG